MDSSLIVIGAGPAGLTAAALAAERFEKVTLVYSGSLGGKLPTIEWIENYPVPGERVGGAELAAQLASDVASAGVLLIEAEVMSLEAYSASAVAILADGAALSASAIIVATGTKNKTLDLPELSKFEGNGLIGCAACDSMFYRDAQVAVVGGGQSGGLDAMHLSRFASQVLLLEKSAELTCEPGLTKAIKSVPNIRIHTDSTVELAQGQSGLSSITVLDRNGGRTQEAVTGLSIQVGYEPATEFLKETLLLSHSGQVPVDHALQSDEPTIFAIGDCRVENGGTVARAVADAQRVMESILRSRGEEMSV